MARLVQLGGCCCCCRQVGCVTCAAADVNALVQACIQAVWFPLWRWCGVPPASYMPRHLWQHTSTMHLSAGSSYRSKHMLMNQSAPGSWLQAAGSHVVSTDHVHAQRYLLHCIL
jgi:hypothetical protein